MPARLYGVFKSTKISLSINEANKLKLFMLAQYHDKSLSQVMDLLIEQQKLSPPLLQTAYRTKLAALEVHIRAGGTYESFMQGDR